MRKRIALFFVVASLSATLVPAFYFWLFDGNALPIEGFVVSESEHIKSVEVRAYLQKYVGKPFYGVDLSQVAAECERHPWVKHVVVRRSPPHTIIVEPTERKAVGVVDEKFLFDEEGSPFLGISKTEFADLPRVQTKGKNRDSADLRRAAEALVSYAAGSKAAGKMKRLVVDDDGCLHVYFDNELYVELGSDKFVERWQKLDAILNHLRKDEQQPDFIYLGNYPNSQQVAVKLRVGNSSRGYINGSIETR
jgi:cell division septal protein FtsQ